MTGTHRRAGTCWHGALAGGAEQDFLGAEDVTDAIYKKLATWDLSASGSLTGFGLNPLLPGAGFGFFWQGDPAGAFATASFMQLVNPWQTLGLAGAATFGFASQANGTSLGPTVDGLAMVQFMTGLSGYQTLDRTAPNFANWKHDSPATYNFTDGGVAASWTPGTTVAYWFDPSSGWTAAERTSFTDALNLWSAEANIQFSLSSTPSSFGIDITRGIDGGAHTLTQYTYSFVYPLGNLSSATVSIDTSVQSWNALGSFSVFGGYGVETVTHELGHALGLGHPGPYDGSAPGTSQVLFTADTRQYTLMSYVDPGSTTAVTVATRNLVTPSPANYTNANGTFYLTTPGQYDILAIQRLYGAPTAVTPLTTGETFGFNASAALKTSLPQFDFTVNTNPVVTIYDSGTGNVLDLSGFSAPSTVDLNPGQFSSVNGMVDNIGIDFTTWVDTAIGGSGNDTFYVNSQADTIDGGGGNNAVVFSGTLTSYVLGRNGGTVTVTSGGITDSLSNIQTLQFADQSVASSSVPCFVRGTRILTPQGEVAVEALTDGAFVCTASGGTRPVKWIGRRTINLRAHPHPPAAAPIRIHRNAFGPDTPCRDLLLSPDHAVLVDDALVPAKLLANGCTVVQELDAAAVEYLHIELDRHDILLAERLPVESYLDTGNRAMFANAGLALILHPDCSVQVGLKSWERDSCAPLRTEGVAVEAVRLRLLERAIGQGCRVADDPCLRLVIRDRALTPVAIDSGRHMFALPAGTQRFHIRSRSAVPTEVGTHAGDQRQLGVAVARMILIVGHESRDVPVDHPSIHHGWHATERDGGQLWRWTDGAALVALSAPVEAGTLLDIRLHGRLPYWTAPSASHEPRQADRMAA